MVGVLPKRLLATAASSPAAAHLLETAASSPAVQHLLAQAASSPAAARLLLTAVSSLSSARLLSTAASAPSAARLISTAASSPAAARILATAASSPAATRLLATAASSPAAAREIAALLPLATQGMIRSGGGGCSGIRDMLLLGNLTNPQAARFMNKELDRELAGDQEGLDSFVTKTCAAGGTAVGEDKDNEFDDKTEDEDDDDPPPPKDDDDDNGNGGRGKRGRVNGADPPPPHNGVNLGNNGGKGNSCLENHILYELSEMRKELRANNWRQYKQSCRVQKEVDDFRKSIDEKIVNARLLLAKAALKILIGIILFLLTIAQLAAPYLAKYTDDIWEQKLRDKVFGVLMGREDTPAKKP